MNSRWFCMFVIALAFIIVGAWRDIPSERTFELCLAAGWALSYHWWVDTGFTTCRKWLHRVTAPSTDAALAKNPNPSDPLGKTALTRAEITRTRLAPGAAPSGSGGLGP